MILSLNAGRQRFDADPDSDDTKKLMYVIIITINLWLNGLQTARDVSPCPELALQIMK